LALPSGGIEPVIQWVTEGKLPELIPVAGDQAMLRKFLNDNGKPDDPVDNVALHWWDILIKFRDTDESVKEEIVRLCHDVQTGSLYATVPPYTERGFTQPQLA
jgi:hypothetical protein